MSADVLNGMITEAASWVWQTSITATGVALLIALFQLVFRKALPVRLRLALWWLVAIRLMIPFPLSSSLSIWNLFKPSVSLPPQDVAALPIRQPDVIVLAGPATQFMPDAGQGLEWIAIASYVWMAGALISLGVVLCQHRKLAAWVRQQPSIDRFDDILSKVILRTRIRGNIRVVETCFLGTPAVFGILHPHILIPRQLLQTLNREELRLVILHELAHIRRMDVLQNWVLIILQSVHWFNPAVWLSFRQLRAEREFVCDAEVLAQLGGERKLYGSTLIQIASSALPTRTSSVLVPILSRKKHIERRVRMIVKFKPMSRIAAAASAVVLAAVAWVTLTGAADRPVPPQGAEASPSPAPTQPAETTARVIDLMRVELARLDAQIDQKQAQMDRLREQLRIAALEEAGTPDPEPLRRMESLRAEQATEHQKLSSLYTGLTNMPRPELLRAISTESPDQLLTALLEQRANVEARYAEAVEAYGSDHPEVKRSRRALDQIQLQIDGRLGGIMEGLKVRAKTAEHSAALLAKEVQQLRKAQIDQAIESRPYFRAKRELDNLESVYDDLHKRLMQAQIEAAIAPSAERK